MARTDKKPKKPNPLLFIRLGDKARTANLFVRMTDAEKQRYDELAKEIGVSLTDLVRSTLESRYAQHMQARAVAAPTTRSTPTRDAPEHPLPAALTTTEPLAHSQLDSANGRFVQTVNVPALERRLIAMDARCGRLEDFFQQQNEIVGGMLQVLGELLKTTGGNNRLLEDLLRKQVEKRR
jgi:hypothetical protein